MFVLIPILLTLGSFPVAYLCTKIGSEIGSLYALPLGLSWAIWLIKSGRLDRFLD